MASQKSFKRIAGILIPSVLTALVCAVDPNIATDGVLATTISLKLMDAVASNWFANTTIEFAEEMFGGRKQIQHYAPQMQACKPAQLPRRTRYRHTTHLNWNRWRATLRVR